ncbi:hypothetical protein DPMN_159813 [Dreissena polymorpha]|uniref:Uncharacterized protein n=1 Tax=Dreissena polymorpha TaxID=45954 RepID=A0A9D4EM45_DREPO|nr:hypothetical protein DPMN_159813 [Dreissena polymorpha]
MKEARSQGKKAWIAYDTLFVDGKPVRDKECVGDELRVLSWNVHGLTALKRDSVDFINIVAKHDIIFLYETWTSDSSVVDIPGYKSFNFYRKF